MALPQNIKINIDNLQTLNDIKLELKTIVDTESNDFSYYPSYVTAYGEDRYDEGYADGEAAGGGSGEKTYAQIIQEYFADYDEVDPNEIWVKPIYYGYPDLEPTHNVEFFDPLIGLGAPQNVNVGDTWGNSQIVLFDVAPDNTYETYEADCLCEELEDPNGETSNFYTCRVELDDIDETHTYFWVFYETGNSYNAYVANVFGNYYADSLTDGGNILCTATIAWNELEEWNEETEEVTYFYEPYYVLEGTDVYEEPEQR